MSYVEQLKQRLKEEAERTGLQSFHFTSASGPTAEEVAKHLLELLDAEEQGLTRPWSDY